MINRLCGAMKKGAWRAITGKCGFRTTSVVRGFAVCALIAVCMAVLALPRNVRADELPDEGMQNVETELERLLNEYDFSEWQQYFDETKQTVGNITEYGDVKTLIEKAASNVIEADEPTSILLIVKDIFVPNSVFGSHRHGCGRNRKDKVFQRNCRTYYDRAAYSDGVCKNSKADESNACVSDKRNSVCN